MFTQIPFCVCEVVRPFRSNSKDGKIKWQTFFQLSAPYGELLGIDGEPIEVDWNIFPGLTSLQILQTIQNDLQERNIEPEQFGDRITFISMSSDTEWTKRGNEKIVFQIQRTSRCTRRDSSRKDMGHSSIQETKRSGMVVIVANSRENGFHRLTDGATIQRNRPPSVHECQCFEPWNLNKVKKVKNPYISMRMLRIWNFYSESFTQQISSVSSEQSQGGAREFGPTAPEKEGTSDKSASKENEEMLKSVNPQ